MAMTYSESVLTAKWRLIDAIAATATQAAEFQVSAENIDRPIADTPWLAAHRYGKGEYDARWYSVMGARDGFVSGLAEAIENEIAALLAVVFMEGLNATEPRHD